MWKKSESVGNERPTLALCTNIQRRMDMKTSSCHPSSLPKKETSKHTHANTEHEKWESNTLGKMILSRKFYEWTLWMVFFFFGINTLYGHSWPWASPGASSWHPHQHRNPRLPAHRHWIPPWWMAMLMRMMVPLVHQQHSHTLALVQHLFYCLSRRFSWPTKKCCCFGCIHNFNIINTKKFSFFCKWENGHLHLPLSIWTWNNLFKRKRCCLEMQCIIIILTRKTKTCRENRC